MKNKKGLWLGETVGKIVIAVLCILILLILGVKLFGIFGEEKEVRKVEDTLNLIEEKIDYLTGPDYTKDFLYVQVFPPEGNWFLRGYKEGMFPEKQCVGRFESCLCMCEGFSCDSLKVCKGFELDVLVDETFMPSTSSGGMYIPAPTRIEGVLQLTESVEELKISEENELIKISKSDRA